MLLNFQRDPPPPPTPPPPPFPLYPAAPFPFVFFFCFSLLGSAIVIMVNFAFTWPPDLARIGSL